MIVCTAKITDENNTDLNVSEVETDGHITSCRKSNMNEVEEGEEEEIGVPLKCNNNSDDINIEKVDVDENLITSSWLIGCSLMNHSGKPSRALSQ